MLLTKINSNDLDKLTQFRIERFLKFFTSSLPYCKIDIDPSNTLIVSCPHPQIVDILLDDLEDLRNCAWLILGVKAVTLHFAQEEILCVKTSLKY